MLEKSTTHTVHSGPSISVLFYGFYHLPDTNGHLNISISMCHTEIRCCCHSHTHSSPQSPSPFAAPLLFETPIPNAVSVAACQLVCRFVDTRRRRRSSGSLWGDIVQLTDCRTLVHGRSHGDLSEGASIWLRCYC